jgi:hypothetical protein
MSVYFARYFSPKPYRRDRMAALLLQLELQGSKIKKSSIQWKVPGGGLNAMEFKSGPPKLSHIPANAERALIDLTHQHALEAPVSVSIQFISRLPVAVKAHTTDVDFALGAIEEIADALDLGQGYSQLPDALPDPYNEDETEADLPIAYHRTVVKIATPQMQSGHWRNAILDCFIALDEAIRSKCKLPDDVYGDALAAIAFKSKGGHLRLYENVSQQDGLMYLFKGAVTIRNGFAHKSKLKPKSEEEACELLAFISMLFRLLDRAKRTAKLPPKV